MVDDTVRDERNKRMRAERERRERKTEEAEERDRHEHPENYAPSDIAAELAKIKARKGEMVIPQIPKRCACCEKCGAPLPTAPSIQSLTPRQLRELADAIEARGSAKCMDGE
jgi:hypothetical protein